MSRITAKKYGGIIRHLDFGASTAEEDKLLKEARIETSAFSELYLDKIDLIRGCKGSGKTALFRLFYFMLREHFLTKADTIFINGADEPRGDAIFQYYSKQFDEFSEQDFLRFWKIYFIYLLNQHILVSKTYSERLAIARSEIKLFEKECLKSQIPALKKDENSLLAILNRTLRAVQSIKSLELTCKPDGAFGAGITFKESETTLIEPTPLFIDSLFAIFRNILKMANLKAWIFIDRLDEVFPRRSEVERRALRSLLRCSNSFHDDSLRLKIFLRDDIFEAVVDTPDGFTALTHIADRSSKKLHWSPDQILSLILMRAFFNAPVKSYYRPNMRDLQKDKNYRLEMFYKMFPKHISLGPSPLPTFDWIYQKCQDGNGIVAPRDVIDLLREAKRWQEEMFQAEPNCSTMASS
jgi:hypothetical protein